MCIEDLRGAKQYTTKLKEVRTALRLLEQAWPRRLGLNSHAYQSMPVMMRCCRDPRGAVLRDVRRDL